MKEDIKKNIIETKDLTYKEVNQRYGYSERTIAKYRKRLGIKPLIKETSSPKICNNKETSFPTKQTNIIDIGFTYVFLCEDKVKIGHTINIENRRKEILSHFKTVAVVCIYPNTNNKFEQHLHNTFQSFRLHGEYYDRKILDYFYFKETSFLK